MKSLGKYALAIVLQICTFALADPPTIPFNNTFALNVTSDGSDPNYVFDMDSPTVQALPPDPFQLRVGLTPTYLIFSQYGQKISSDVVVRICFGAQAEIIEAIVINHGDGVMPKLRPLWWYKNIYMTISPVGTSSRMTWLMLARTFTGIVQFIETYGAIAVQIEVLDAILGPVGKGKIAYSPNPPQTS